MIINKYIVRSEYEAGIPDLEQLNPIGVAWPLRGAPVSVGAHCHWRADVTERLLGSHHLINGEVSLRVSGAHVTLHGARTTQAQFPYGAIEGSALSIEWRSDSSFGPREYRQYVQMTSDLAERVLFPASVGDQAWMSVSYLPLVIHSKCFDVFFLKEQSRLVIEASAGCILLGEFLSVCGVIRTFLTYLTGRRFGGPFFDVVVDAKSGLPAQVTWHTGRGRKSHNYAAVPTSYAEWGAASESLGFRFGERTPLDPAKISQCVERIIDEPRLSTAIEYIVAFPDAPVEMRGALLSVALEALTDHLESKGLLASVKPLGEEEWRSLRGKLIAQVSASAVALGGATKHLEVED